MDKLSLTFPCHKPLGFYVTTVAAESLDQSRYVIASIAPSLQNKMLRVGAIVTEAASFNSDRITVLHSHSQLKDFYHAAKINHSKITLWFDNSQSQYELNDLSSNWTANYAWLQDESDGRASGSPLASSTVVQRNQYMMMIAQRIFLIFVILSIENTTSSLRKMLN